MRKMFTLLFAILVTSTAYGQDVKMKVTTIREFRQTKDGTAHVVHFTPLDKLRGVKPANARTFDHAKTKPVKAVQLPIDWAKSISFPMLLNDQLGCCYYSAAGHAEQTWTGNNGTVTVFDLKVFRQRYLALSGGDNGLADQDMQGEWTKRYIADVVPANIVDFMYIDVKNPAAVQSAIYHFGCVMFTMGVPNNWINDSDTGTVWDVPAVANQRNGHAVIFNGVQTNGNCTLQTWSTHVYITPAGIKACDPDGWVALSSRWFNSKGFAPNGLHVTQVAKVWTDGGGGIVPVSFISQFPPLDPTPPPPPLPPPPPGPSPSGVTLMLNADLKKGVYEVHGVGTLKNLEEFEKLKAQVDALKKLIDSFSKPAPKLKSAMVEPTLDDLRTVIVAEGAKTREALSRATTLGN